MKSPSWRLYAALVFAATLLAARADEIDVPKLEAQAEAGDVKAMVELAEHYRDTINDEDGNEHRSLLWFRRAAEKGDASAQLELGLILRDGRGTPADPEEAFQWLLKAAEHGDRYAMFVVAGAYAEGELVGKNLVQALRWYRSAAEKGDMNAAFEAGAMLADGRGTKRDSVEAAKWLTLAARADNAEARDKLAELVAADPQLAAKLAAQAPAETKALLARATAGEAKAQFEVAQLYATGAGGLPRDRAARVQWLQKAAAQGHAEAQCALGLAYRQGEGVAESAEQALAWLKKAADQNLPAALVNLSRFNLRGEGGAKEDPAEAARLLRRAADLGSVEAMNDLAKLHRYRGFAPKSDAIQWYVRAAETGDVDAMLGAGTAYEEDAGDLASALRWYRAAAAKDNDEARDHVTALESKLAAQEFADRIPEKISDEARSLYVGALRGEAKAQLELALLLRDGTGVPQDIVSAQEWFAKAGAQGLDEARRWAEQLANDPKFHAAKATAEFEEGFLLAPTRKRRRAAVEKLCQSIPSGLSDTGQAEFVFRLVGPKMDAHPDEAGDYMLSISLPGATTVPALRAFCSAATVERVVAHAKKVSAGYEAGLVARQAINGFSQRARDGDAQAQFQMGEFYLSNTVERNVDEAADWLVKAAAQGHAEGRRRLRRGRCSFRARQPRARSA